MAEGNGLTVLARTAKRSGIFCDFDGCLAPIVDDPDEARAVDGADAILEGLAARFRVVAVVSGRSVADLAGRVRAPGVRLIGLHGMEELRDGRVQAAAGAEQWRAAVARAAARLEEVGVSSGAVLERKGLALAVHFRRAPDPEAAERLADPLVHEAAAAEGLVVVPGRRILEVRPAGGGDKGDALGRVIREEGLRGAMFGGDDVGDIPAFAALDEVEVALRVAVASPESRTELLERADLVVESPEAFVALLEELARATAV